MIKYWILQHIYSYRFVSRMSLDGDKLEPVGPSKFARLNGIAAYRKSDIRTGNIVDDDRLVKCLVDFVP